MKQVLILISLVIFITHCSIDSSAQTLALNESAKSSQKKEAGLPRKLAAIVIQSKENKFSIGLHIESYVEGKISIKLTSATAVLHKEVVESKTYARKYDMFNLPVGDYQIEVENKHEVYRKKMSIRVNNGLRVLTLM